MLAFDYHSPLCLLILARLLSSFKILKSVELSVMRPTPPQSVRKQPLYAKLEDGVWLLKDSGTRINATSIGKTSI